MKKISLLVIGLMSMTNFYGQDLNDALRYSSDNITGTARFAAMSGAFGALGGDLTAIGINPAGSAVFTKSYASISLSYLTVRNEVGYFNNQSTDDASKFDIHQIGAAFVFANGNIESPWRKLVLSVAYDKTNDFKNRWGAAGANTNSIYQYFLGYAQGQRLDEISAFPEETIGEAYNDIGQSYGYGNQQAFLGYESFILDPEVDSDENTAYISNVGDGSFNQNYSYRSIGYNGKFSVNVASQFGDNLFVGLNLNSHFINFEKSTYLFESNNNVGSFVTEIDFQNNLRTTGNGFSLQIGGIYKLTNELRAGLSYSSPTWFRIFEETTQYVSTLVNDETGDFRQIVDPGTVNIFPEYRLRSPSSYKASLAYVFGEQGLISFDYGRKDYGNIEFRPTDDPAFRAQNDNISNSLKSAATYNFGAEYRVKTWSFRGGYRFEESPYENEDFYGNLSGYSLGLGYNFGNFKLDVAYTDHNRDYNQRLYESGLTDTARLKSDNKNVILSLGFSL
ncbi:Outer membrane protein transport protein (OMPP1/FadL/TodX) [Flavobacteriaceae bacterium MAR_2010_188]|nr:Outer membrane protein transport protein (OMPP1/FadL/TodX) [Flavobacteriaceae bacterium MAR_2010_188]